MENNEVKKSPNQKFIDDFFDSVLPSNILTTSLHFTADKKNKIELLNGLETLKKIK